MANRFVVTRVGNERFRICYGLYRAECLGHDDGQLRSALGFLGLDRTDARLARELREAMDRFLFLEGRSREKFGKPTVFRIWRVDRRRLQVDFDGGYAELWAAATGERTLKRCLADLGANDLLYPDLERELKEFLKRELLRREGAEPPAPGEAEVKPRKPKRRNSGNPFGITPDEAVVVARIRDMRKAGTGLADIAAHLNETEVRSPRGLKWGGQTVMNVLRQDARRRRAEGSKPGPPDH
jgi:hypothetical protein